MPELSLAPGPSPLPLKVRSLGRARSSQPGRASQLIRSRPSRDRSAARHADGRAPRIRRRWGRELSTRDLGVSHDAAGYAHPMGEMLRAGCLRSVSLAPGPSHLGLKVRPIGGNPSLREAGLRSNDFYLLLYLEGGPGRFRLARSEWSIEPGDVFVVAPGQVHDASDLVNARGSAVAFSAETVVAAGAAAEGRVALPGDPRWLAFIRQPCLMESRYAVQEDDRRVWEERILNLQSEVSVQRVGFEQAARALLTLLLVETTRLAMPRLAESESPAPCVPHPSAAQLPALKALGPLGRVISKARGVTRKYGGQATTEGAEAVPRSLGAASRGDEIAKKLKLDVNSPTTRQVLNNLDTKVTDFIGQYRQGKIRRQFPGEFLDRSVEEAIVADPTVRKLLLDKRFAK